MLLLLIGNIFGDYFAEEREFSSMYFNYFTGLGLGTVASFGILVFFLYDYLCFCCCNCFLGAEDWTVFDPENHEANLVWRDGEILDKDEAGEKEKKKVSNCIKASLAITYIMIITITIILGYIFFSSG